MARKSLTKRQIGLTNMIVWFVGLVLVMAAFDLSVLQTIAVMWMTYALLPYPPDTPGL